MFEKDSRGSSLRPVSVVGQAGVSAPLVELHPGDGADTVNLDHCKTVAEALGCQINWQVSHETSNATAFLGMTDKTEKALLDMATGPDAPANGAQAVMVNVFSAPRKSSPLDVILSCPLSSASARTTAQAGSSNWSVAAQIVKTAVDNKRKHICYVRDDSGIDKIDLAPASLQMAALNNNFKFECQSEEAALAALLRNPQRWDMIICRPAIRRMLAALFVERAKLGVMVPFAVLSPTRNLFGAEKRVHPDQTCPTVHAQLLALVAMMRSLGIAHAAQRLENALRDIINRGICVEGLGETLPYGTVMSEQDYVATVIETLAGQERKSARLKLMGK